MLINFPYLDLCHLNISDPYSAVIMPGQTEWETEREREEFVRAAKLYKPLAGMMAMRFTTGKQQDDGNQVDVKVEENVGYLYNFKITIKPVLSGHSKIDKTKVLKTNGSLMKVEVLQNALLEHSAIL